MQFTHHAQQLRNFYQAMISEQESVCPHHPESCSLLDKTSGQRWHILFRLANLLHLLLPKWDSIMHTIISHTDISVAFYIYATITQKTHQH